MNNQDLNILKIKVRNEILQKKTNLDESEMLDLLNKIHEDLSISLYSKIIPSMNRFVLKLVEENNHIDWLNKENNNLSIKYFELKNDREEYTVHSLIHYAIKEVDLEKILWYELDFIIEKNIKKLDNKDYIKNFKIYDGLSIFKQIRTLYLYPLVFNYKLTFISNLLKKQKAS